MAAETPAIEENKDDIDSDDDGLPPLEANTNRQQPTSLWQKSDSDSVSDDE